MVLKSDDEECLPHQSTLLTSVVALDAGEARRPLSPDWEINASSALERLRDRCHDTLRVRLDPFTDLTLFENQKFPFPYFLCPFFIFFYPS